jgi:hypothetical protein
MLDWGMPSLLVLWPLLFILFLVLCLSLVNHALFYQWSHWA